MNKDFFEKDATTLKDKKLFLFDMDGTMCDDHKLYDGAVELFDTITKKGGKYVFITNNSSNSSKSNVERLKNMGLTVTSDTIFSSVNVSAIFLKKNYPNTLVYVQGTKALIDELKENGIQVTEEVNDDIGVVLIGFDTELTFAKIKKTCEVLTKKDVPYYATNLDLACPVSFGFVPDNGSTALMIKNATGKMPISIGKPDPTMVTLACEKFGFDKKDSVVIGDRLYTDIASGINANVDTICVLTGEATVEQIKDTEFTPDYVFESVKEINEAIK